MQSNHTTTSLIKTAMLVIALVALAAPAQAVRVKDLASVQGVRGNQLVGYGLVVGLNGTGDGNKSPFTTQALTNMLKNVGMVINQADLKVKNVAGVMVTATLPPFIKAGQPLDVTLSSLGDASSLQGGTLVATPLKGLDDEIYAMAQGPVSIGGFKATGPVPDGSQTNHLTVARVPNGATVEREVPVSFAGKNMITLSLNSPDFTTVSRMTKAINTFLGSAYAKAADGATVTVAVPETYREQQVALLAALEMLDVDPDAIAKVVVDERTGTIVMGENVRIGELALSHGTLSIRVAADPNQIGKDKLGKPLTDDMVREMTAQLAANNGKPQENRVINLTPGVTLAQLVRALNSVGAAPRDLIAIFQAIKAAGAMQAELTII
jgi:flagellar P-ring protein precursor FlgI